MRYKCSKLSSSTAGSEISSFASRDFFTSDLMCRGKKLGWPIFVAVVQKPRSSHQLGIPAICIKVDPTSDFKPYVQHYIQLVNLVEHLIDPFATKFCMTEQRQGAPISSRWSSKVSISCVCNEPDTFCLSSEH